MLIYMSIKTAACSNIVGLRNPEGCQKVAGGRSAELRPPVRHEKMISPRRGDRASASSNIQDPQQILHIVFGAREKVDHSWVSMREDSGTPPGCLRLFPEFRGSARRARTPGYPLATLRVAGACAPGFVFGARHLSNACKEQVVSLHSK